MATINLSAIPYTVTAGDTNDNDLTLLGSFETDGLVVKLTVVSGTIKFNNIGAADSSNVSYTAGQSVLLTFIQGQNISFKAASGADTFTVEV